VQGIASVQVSTFANEQNSRALQSGDTILRNVESVDRARALGAISMHVF
jgi:hypothetical protein